MEALKRIDKGESLKSMLYLLVLVKAWKKKRIEIESFCSKLGFKNTLESRSTLKKHGRKNWMRFLYGLTRNEPMESRSADSLLKKRLFCFIRKWAEKMILKASEGWLNRWKKRLGIHMLMISGEMLSFNPEEAAKFRKKFEVLVGKKRFIQ